MRSRERRGTRVRVLCRLLAVLTLAGLGLFPGGHCIFPIATDTNVAAADATDPVTHGHHHHPEDDGADPHGMIEAGADDCHLLPASIPAARSAADAVTWTGRLPREG